MGEFLPGIFGGGSTPGLFGQGHYKYDPNAFNIPGIDQATANANQYATANAAGSQAGQAQLQQMLQTQAAGGGFNPATQELQSATDANTKNAMALGQSMPGNSNMAAARSILDNQAKTQQEAAGQAGQLTGETALKSQGQLASLLGQEQAGSREWQQMANDLNSQKANAAIALQTGQANAYANQASNALLGKPLVGGAANGASSSLMSGGGGGGGAAAGAGGGGAEAYTSDALMAAHGGTIPGGHHPSYVAGVLHGHALAMLSGGNVPGRAAVSGDSTKNDTVPTWLSPGEEVIPRSVAGDEDKEAAFLRDLHKSKAPKPTFADVLVSHRAMSKRMSTIEALCYGGRAAA